MSHFKAEVDNIRKELKNNTKGLTVTDISKKLGISRNTAAKYLDLMLNSNEVEEQQFGKARVFYLTQRVPAATLLEHSSDLIVVINEDFDILQVNSSWLAYFNLTTEDLIGKNLISDPLFQKRYARYIRDLIDAIKLGKDEAVFHVQGMVLSGRFLSTTFLDGSAGYTMIFEDATSRIRFSDTLIALHKFSKELHRCKTELELFDITRNAMIDILGFDRADIWMIDGDVLVQVSSDVRLPKEFIIPLDAQSIVVKTVREKRTIHVPDVTVEPDYLFAEQIVGEDAVVGFEKSFSELATPVYVGKEVVGVLNIESTLRIPFTDNDITLLEMLSLHLGSSLETMRARFGGQLSK